MKVTIFCSSCWCIIIPITMFSWTCFKHSKCSFLWINGPCVNHNSHHHSHRHASCTSANHLLQLSKPCQFNQCLPHMSHVHNLTHSTKEQMTKWEVLVTVRHLQPQSFDGFFGSSGLKHPSHAWPSLSFLLSFLPWSCPNHNCMRAHRLWKQ